MNETSSSLLGLDISIISLDLLRHATISRLLPYLIQIQFDACQPTYISLPGDLAIYRPFLGGTGAGTFAILQGHPHHFCQKKRFRVSVVVLQQSPNIDSATATSHLHDIHSTSTTDIDGYMEHSRGVMEWEQDPSSPLYLVDGNTMSSRLRVFGAPAILATFPSIKIDLMTVTGDSCGSLRVAIAIVDVLKVTDRRRIASTGRVVPDTRRTVVPAIESLPVPLHHRSSTTSLPAASVPPSSSAAVAVAVAEQLPILAQTPASTAALFPEESEESANMETIGAAVTPMTPTRTIARTTTTSTAMAETITEASSSSSSSSSAAAAVTKVSPPSAATTSTPAPPASPSPFVYEREELDESPSDSRDYTTKDEGESTPSR